MNLPQTEKLHDLLSLGANSDNTTDTNDKSNLRFRWDIEPSVGFGCTTVGYKVVGDFAVFSIVFGAYLVLVLCEFFLSLLGSLGSSKGISSDFGLGGLLF